MTVCHIHKARKFKARTKSTHKKYTHTKHTHKAHTQSTHTKHTHKAHTRKGMAPLYLVIEIISEYLKVVHVRLGHGGVQQSRHPAEGLEGVLVTTTRTQRPQQWQNKLTTRMMREDELGLTYAQVFHSDWKQGSARMMPRTPAFSAGIDTLTS